MKYKRLRRVINDNYFCRSDQEHLGCAIEESTMIYPHALERGPSGVTSLTDRRV